MTVSGDYEFSIPPRSHLYSLEPIGIGTPYVESLTSYITRLAQVHWVSVSTLLSQKLIPTIGLAYMLEGNGPHRFYRRSQALNGVGKMAKDWVKATEDLTLRTDLRVLTLLKWANLLTVSQLSRQYKAWCPKCYEEWQTVYEPLIWNLQAVMICPKHRFPLHTQCPHCSRRQPLLDWRSLPGYCSKCRKPLGDLSDYISLAYENTKEIELDWQIWVTDNIGALLTSELQAPLQGRLAEAISASIMLKTDGNIAAFARMLHSPKNTVWLWQAGKIIPPLREILRLCHLIEVPLMEFLLEKDFTRKMSDSTFSCAIRASNTPKSPCRSFNKIKIGQSLQSELLSHNCPPPALRDIAQRFNTSTRHLRKHFPELCSAISRKFSLYKRSRRHQRELKLYNDIKSVVFDLHSRGLLISQTNVAKHLSQSGVFRESLARKILEQLQNDLTI